MISAKARLLWSRSWNFDPMHAVGGTTGGILYLVFPGSGNGGPGPIEEINAGAEQFSGGNDQLIACGIR
jgi:hypothetical protein